MSYKLGQTLYYCIEEYESAIYIKSFMTRKRWMDGVVINKDSGGGVVLFVKYIPNKFLYESKIPTGRVEEDRLAKELGSTISEVDDFQVKENNQENSGIEPLRYFCIEKSRSVYHNDIEFYRVMIKCRIVSSKGNFYGVRFHPSPTKCEEFKYIPKRYIFNRKIDTSEVPDILIVSLCKDYELSSEVNNDFPEVTGE